MTHTYLFTVIQNEAQGYHWNNKQATIHPFVVYFKDSNNVLQHTSFIIISESLIHDSVAVNLYIDKLINFMKSKFSQILKIIYMTDGAASQYKNKKNFKTMTRHYEEYGITAEWHFHATSHGKGPCDGIGGTLKRKAARASLSKEFDKVISTPFELYQWAVENMQMEFCYISAADYTRKEIQLNDIYNQLKTITGTRSFHAFIPINNKQIKTKFYSNSEKFKVFDI